MRKSGEKPFEIFGHPNFKNTPYNFIPKSVAGAKTPPHLNNVCYGYDLSTEQVGKLNRINLQYLLEARRLLGDSAILIDQKSFFNKLAGNEILAEQIMQMMSEDDIRKSWQTEIDSFKQVRAKYLMYKD